MILDSCVLIDLLRENRAAVSRLRSLVEQGEPLIVPSPAIFELWEGSERSDHPEQEARTIERVVRALETRPLDAATAARAGRMAGALGRKGHAGDPLDVMIAAFALEAREPLLTRNARDFEAFADLEVVPY